MAKRQRERKRDVQSFGKRNQNTADDEKRVTDGKQTVRDPRKGKSNTHCGIVIRPFSLSQRANDNNSHRHLNDDAVG
jgi:hypothetical protein